MNENKMRERFLEKIEIAIEEVKRLAVGNMAPTAGVYLRKRRAIAPTVRWLQKNGLSYEDVVRWAGLKQAPSEKLYWAEKKCLDEIDESKRKAEEAERWIEERGLPVVESSYRVEIINVNGVKIIRERVSLR